MRSLVLLRFSVAAGATIGLAAFAAQLANLTPAIPKHHLELAWTLAQVLIQL